ncbi:hypothetical protein FQN54_009483 [Arachnomyces sp. PD_36]|nr:hypothetical protein FQN54_009483 [Arachnomyces sp. PD_36]
MAAKPAPPVDLNESIQDLERTLTTVCVVVVAIAMGLRTFGRYCLKLKNDRERINTSGHFLGLDDIFNFFAVATFFGLCTATYIAIDRGMGTHVQVVTKNGLDGLSRYNLAIYNCAIFYNSTLGFVKLSVLALYRRILQGVSSERLKIANWIVFAIVTMNTVINVGLALFQCQPISAAFDMNVKGTCINTNAFYLGNAITGIITDTLVYTLSIPIIKPLNMEPKKKIVTLLTLLVGAFAVITSCIRLSFIPDLLVNPDTTWAMGLPMCWSVVEPAVGAVVSSVPAITAIRHFRSSPGNTYGTNSNSLKSRTDGHVQLKEYGNSTGNRATINYGGDSEASLKKDNDSEEHLVSDKRGGGISRTTEVHVSYD